MTVEPGTEERSELMSALASDGMAAIGRLTEQNRRSASAGTEAELARLRIAAGQRLYADASGLPASAPAGDDLFPGERGLPEVSRQQLNRGSLAAGVLHHGGLIVRGLYDTAQLRRLAEAAKAEAQLGTTGDERLGCSPHTLFELLEIYRDCGLLDVVRDYLGAGPLLFAERVKLRCHWRQRDKYAAIPWHQDAAFFGRKCYAVNCWAAVSPCGEENPGLSIVPRRTEEIHGWDPREGHAPLDYGRSIPEAEFTRMWGGQAAVDCILQPGDAVLFDEMTVHQTLLRPWRREEQLVTISWFFRPQDFPAWGTPLAV